VYTRLGETELTTGERMEIGVVDCPDREWAARVAPLLGHKGPEWSHHIRSALREPLDGLQTLFYLGLVDGTAISNVMIVGTRRPAAACGILGHVFTRPEQRRKGAYGRLMAAQMAHTRQLGYGLLTLGTGFESPPYWIYHRFGFRSIDGVSGRMKWSATPDAEAAWFRAGETGVRPMRWDDWPALNLLAYRPTEPDEEAPRSTVFRLAGHGSLEGSFLRAWPPLAAGAAADAAEPRPAALTLETEHGAAVGWAIVQPDAAAPGDRWLLDCYVHPDFRAETGRLLAAVPWPAGKAVVAYSGPPDGYRAAALLRAGFEVAAGSPDAPDWLAAAAGEAGAPSASLRVYARPPA
jgi:GNAT superfamily N-acetyltransferase